MPELPEVETIRLGLAKYLVGHVIEDVEVRLPKIITGDTKQVTGACVIGVRRFGKGLVIDLSNNYSIAVHVKMTGQLIYQGKKRSEVSKEKVGSVPNSFTHFIFHLNKGAKLYYNDMRQFGWIKIVESSKLKMQSFFKNLGPEPFKDLTIEIFSQILKKNKTAIKPLLMDQTKISGVGNIYANDALFLAKINPKRSAQSLSEKETKTLFDALLKVLQKGIDAGGASEWHYVNVLGQTGKYQNFFLVYNKKTCKNCKGKITKIKLGGRGTYFCQNCQQ